MGEQHWAAVCVNGHVKTSHVPSNIRDFLARDQLPRPTLIPHYCGLCGGKILVACRSCDSGIVGEWEGDRDAWWRPDAFCWKCGVPYPWATREQRINQLYALVDDEDLEDEADLLAVREQIAVLSKLDGEVTEGQRVRAGETIKRLAPKAWEVFRPVAQTVLTAEVKRRLGLP